MDIHPEEAILEILEKHPEGLTITSIASLANLHRHTVTKYIRDLILSGCVQERYVGMAKLCYLSKHALDEVEIGKKAEAGQTQILLSLLVLLIVPVLIIAQTISNSTTTTGDFVEIIDSSNDTSSSSSIDSTSISSSSMTSTVETTTILVENIQNTTENSTDNTSLVIDSAVNVTQESSEFSNETMTNDTTTTTILSTTIETTTTVDIITVLPESYSVDVIVEAPEKITRGQSLSLRSIVTNNLLTDTPITITWGLPEGFDLISGESVYICGIIQPTQSCIADINISTSLSTDVGLKQVRIVVSYD